MGASSIRAKERSRAMDDGSSLANCANINVIV
jgi:hypothetical protein